MADWGVAPEPDLDLAAAVNGMSSFAGYIAFSIEHALIVDMVLPSRSTCPLRPSILLFGREMCLLAMHEHQPLPPLLYP